jgi:hypothetical protein
MPLSCFYVAMISLRMVGVRVMLYNDESGSTQVIDSSPKEHTAGM